MSLVSLHAGWFDGHREVTINARRILTIATTSFAGVVALAGQAFAGTSWS